MKFCWDYFALDFGFYQDFNYLFGFFCFLVVFFFLASTLHSITSRCWQLNVAFPLVVFVLLILYFSFLLHYHCGLNRIFTLSMQTTVLFLCAAQLHWTLFFYRFVHCKLFRTNSTVRPGRYRMSGLLWRVLRWHQNSFYSLWKPTTTLHFTCNVKELKLGIFLWLLTIFLISSVSVGLKLETRLCFIQLNWWFCESLAIF